MRLVLFVRLAILLCLLPLALPGGAEAKRGFRVINRSLQLELSTPASNGYELTVSTRGHHRVELTLRRKFERWVTYTTRGRVSREAIEADFGRLGRIDVHFRPLRGSRFSAYRSSDSAHRGCRGRRPIFAFGSFHGTIRFRGENGFAQANVRSADGWVDRQFRRVCKRRSGLLDDLEEFFEELFGPAKIDYLIAIDRSPRHTLAFATASFDLGPGLESRSATATALEKREGMRIERFTSVEGNSGSLLVSPKGRNPIAVTATPPSPFRGTADFQKAKGVPATWTGSLRAPLPGVGLVSLTGDEFRTTLCRFQFKDLLKPRATRCVRRSGVPLPGPLVAGQAIGAQIKGSQSQAFGDARLSWSR